MDKPSVQALSWKIATEPKLYWELAQSPYSPKAKEILIQRFPDVSTADMIRAIIMAEPEGRYDRDFKQLPTPEQEAKLAQSAIETSQICGRLNEYFRQHQSELSQMSEDLVYQTLFGVTFGTTDLETIGQRLSQNQRKEVKLFILFLINEEKMVSKPGKTLVKAAVLALLPATLFFYLGFVFLKPQNVPKPAEVGQVLSVEAQKTVRDLPVRLKIPSINIDANIADLGLTTDGAMDVPANTIDVGWYKLGPSPGEAGNAVISGHLDGRKGEIGVFNDLDKLKPGDTIEVVNDKGVKISFVVRESKTYNPGSAPEVFISNDNRSHLNLITCIGTWNVVKKSYSQRLVVFADII